MRISISQAIDRLNNGQVIALPTETVYGLAASIRHPQAIRKIYTLKSRPSANPLIVHVSSIQEVLEISTDIPTSFYALVDAFWPGPLTMILKIDESLISSDARAGLSTAGFRMPSHPISLEIIKETGALVMPSANLSGKPSSTTAEHVEADFGLDFPVVDGGSCQKGLESTILYFDNNKWIVVRRGALSVETIAEVLGYTPEVREKANSSTPLSPGQGFRHYAPEAKLILSDEIDSNVDCLIGFKNRSYPKGKTIYTLGNDDDPQTVAENLYSVLRFLDEKKVQIAWVDMNFPKGGIWDSIRERLTRAAERASSENEQSF